MNKYMRVRRARAGGKKRGLQERKESLLKYHLNPHFCHECGKMLEVGKRRVADVIKKKFCDNKCSAIHNNKKFPSRYSKRVDNNAATTAL